MICKNCVFTNFRNIESAEVSFSEGINVLWGKNAQGKSNILEGIYYFARGRSFRGAKDREMILFGKEYARLEMNAIRESADYETPLEIIIPSDDKARKKVFRNKAALSGMAELIGSFRAVLFCPAHLFLVSGAPHLRRQFLDIAISQLSEEYMSNLAKYKKLLTHRNALLKSAAKGESVPQELWETLAFQMAQSGAVISSYRYEYMSMLSAEMEKLFHEMMGEAEVPRLTYTTHTVENKFASEVALEDAEDEADTERAEVDAAETMSFGAKKITSEVLYSKLTGDIEREMRHGSTLWGSHKDDVKIKLNGNSAKLYASQGQMRSLALAMKLAEGELSHRISGEKPVILLDDVLSELDIDRRTFVLGSLSDRQIIVTSCEPSLFEAADCDVELLNVENGKVRKL